MVILLFLLIVNIIKTNSEWQVETSNRDKLEDEYIKHFEELFPGNGEYQLRRFDNQLSSSLLGFASS